MFSFLKITQECKMKIKKKLRVIKNIYKRISESN